MCWFIEHLPRMEESNPEWHIYTSGKDSKFTLCIFQPQLKNENNNEKIFYTKSLFSEA